MKASIQVGPAAAVGRVVRVGAMLQRLPLPAIVLAVLTLSISDAVSGAEGDSGMSTLDFVVTLSAPSTKVVTVDYATTDNTATAGVDYVAASGTLTFAPGETAKTISIEVVGDADVEADETFFVDLAAATNATIVGVRGVGTITNDDIATAVAFVDDNFTGAAGTTLNGRTPDTVGSAWANYAYFTPLGSFPADERAYSILDGAGAWSFDNGSATDSNTQLTSGSPVSADYFLEATIKVTGEGDNGSWNGALAARCQDVDFPNDGLQWEVGIPGSPDYGVNIYYSDNTGDPYPTSYVVDLIQQPPVPWEYGDEIVIALSVVGRTVTGWVKVGAGAATPRFQITRQTSTMDPAGRPVWGFRSFANILDTTKQVLRLRAAYGPYDGGV